MSATQLLSIPAQALTAGQTYGPYPTAAVGAVYSAYQLVIDQGAAWPASGDVFTLTVERSTDGGTTWMPRLSQTVSGGSWGKANAPTTSGTTSFGSPADSTAADLYRLTLHALQDCSPSFVLSGLS